MLKKISTKLIAGICVLLAAGTLSAGTINGTVTQSGGGALSGAVVRTEGAPSYSATTGTDGNYSLTLPTGAFVVLASKSGYNPQRVYVSAGAGTVNFALRTVDTGQIVSLPAPLNWGEPPYASTAPGDNYPVAFADTASFPAADAPKIADYNDCVKPDESFTLVGDGFTTRTGADAGSDTTVWVWARTSSTGGVLRQARIWSVQSASLVATIPDDVPFGMYLVWVENSAGVSAPICINKPAARWIGPIDNKVAAGSTKRVFGRNLTYGHGVTRANSSDPVTSYVYIQPAAGGAFIACPTTTPTPATAPNLAEPYAVMFTVPAGTPNGSYKLFVHNGHGGAYGWSDGLDLVVQPQFVRGTGVLNLSPRGGSLDDTANIQSAINTVSGYSNGGTVQLSSGTFIISGQINSGTGVNLKGAGMDSTTLLWHGSGSGPFVRLGANNSALSNLTLHAPYGYGIPYNGQLSVAASGVLMDSLRVDSDLGDDNWKNENSYTWIGVGAEMRGCEMYRAVNAQWNCWIHDNNLYGDMGPWYYAEGPCQLFGWYNIFENNHVETRNWPIEPDGTRNYKWWEHFYDIWAKRMVLTYCNSSYVGHNNTKDVAVDDNRGEMVLFHGHGSFWFGQVLSNSGLTMTVRTDGLVFDQPYTMPETYYPPYAAGQPLTDRWDWWAYDNGSREIQIIAGKGAGQIRHVQGNGITVPDKITVDSPWGVEPDSTSVALFGGAWWENIVYDNELNAFPPGYSFDPSLDQAQTGYASCGVVIDGNGYRNVAEGNTSRRTNYGRTIYGGCDAPSLFNEMRDEQAIDANTFAFTIMQRTTNPVGTLMYGNAFRNCSGNVLATTGWAALGQGVGAIMENMNLTSSIGYCLGFHTYGSDGSPTLYRNGTIAVNNAPLQPVYVGAVNGKELLVNNKYSGSSQTYSYSTGLSAYSVPVALQRVARFRGYVGVSVQDVLVSMANAGTAPMTWTVTPSDSWITANAQANGTVKPEGTMGRLAVAVDTTGMTAGKHWGYVDVVAGAKTVRIGVSVDLASGPPPNQSPNAVFAPTPVVGTAPRSVAFSALASNDPDGSIVSYYWDFGDGSYGSGAVVSHVYTTDGTFTPMLTVTDNDGLTDSAWTNITVSPSIGEIALAGAPGAPIDPGTMITLTAGAVGGYQTQFKFLGNSGSGWTVIRDFQTGNTCQYTPSAAGYYEFKAQVKASDSTNVFDKESNILSYPVGQIPVSGMKLWLKADAGIAKDGDNKVSRWTDQSSGNNTVFQANSASYQPTLVDNVVNGRPVVRFGNAGGQYMQALGGVITSTGSFTSFEVVKFASLSPGVFQYLWWTGADNYITGYGTYLNSNSPQRLDSSWGSKSYKVEYPNDIVLDSWYRISSRYAKPTHQMWVNGSPIGSSSYTGSNLGGGVFTIGNFGPNLSKGLRGDIAEMLIYNRNLSDTEMSNVESYLTARWSPPVPVGKDRIKDVKALGDGVLVSITSAKIAVASSGVYSDGGYYIEEPDRTCGMKLVGGPAVSLWDNLTITGVVGTDATTSERVLIVSTIDSQASGTELGSLGKANKAFGADGQLVRVWGKVTAVNGSTITVDDGSGVPVKVQIDGLVTALPLIPSVGNYVSITGPAGLMAGGLPVVRPRSGSDIRAY